ncbi:MAG TPA: hypothetical protein VIE43_12305 [Thermoanaerobaculia bacterium]|nr:hypothetical protein [Thermoanaerobaculia bacterium]
MNHRIVALLAVLGLFAGQGLWAEPPAAAAGSHLLDGKTFYGRETVKGGAETIQSYVFKDGTFEARGWGLHGFHPGPYAAYTEGDAVLFSAQAPGPHPEAGPAQWQGKVVGDHIEVTGVLPNPGHPQIKVAGQADLGDRARASMMFPLVLGRKTNLPRLGTPEYDHAVDLVYQLETMATIRTLGSALFGWATEHGLPGADLGSENVVEVQSLPVVAADQLRPLLIPRYFQTLETTDAWGRPIEMRADLKVPLAKHSICLRSPGADGKFSGGSYPVGIFPPDDVDQDIVWCDGRFVREPKKAAAEAAQKPARPNVEQTPQAVTMTRIRLLGGGLLAWIFQQVPKMGINESAPDPSYNLQSYPLATEAQLRQRLGSSFFGIPMDTTDGWGRPLEMRVHWDALQAKHVLCLRSAGSDGKFSGDTYQTASFPPSAQDQDIVWCDGWFVRWPEGASHDRAQKPAARN